MQKQFLLFDLDGTLTDPKVGITKSVQHALAHYGITVDNRNDLLPFIGPPLRDSFKQFYGFSDEGATGAIDKYREYFSETGIYENSVYPGIDHLLETLNNQGKTLILATSKPTVYAKRILQHFHIDQFFTFISGSELDGRRTDKSEVIQYAFAHCPDATLDNAVMIGDRKHDITGANKVGIDSIGVLYGYGDYEELSAAGATRIVKDVSELLSTLTAVN